MHRISTKMSLRQHLMKKLILKFLEIFGLSLQHQKIGGFPVIFGSKQDAFPIPKMFDHFKNQIIRNQSFVQ